MVQSSDFQAGKNGSRLWT